MANPVISKHNPLDVIKDVWLDADTSHIKFNPDIEMEYSIIRSTGHDGTLIFTAEMIRKALLPLVAMHSYFKPTTPNFNKLKKITYTVGWMVHTSEYKEGMELCCGTYPGILEEIVIPVKCEYIY